MAKNNSRLSVRQAKCPVGRISNSTKYSNGRQIVDLSTYIPHLLSTVNNALSRGASHIYLEKFGTGIVEWRVMSMLAIEPGIQASRICEVIAIDKAAASRALSRLNEAGCLNFEAPDIDPRKKVWWLNEKGYRLHDDILVRALEREKTLIEGIDPEDLESFLRVMRAMRNNVDRLK